ncbi:MAG: SecDF P1 head subdomain-containing protein [Crocinitomicaceae bacterium]|jgi:preprotein translocase subunit SecD
MIWNFFKPITAFVIFSFIINILGCSTDKETTKPGNVEFYETYFASEILTEWQEASLISSRKELELKDSLVQKSNSSSSSTVSIQKGLSDLIRPYGEYAIGSASKENKSKVESLLKRKDVIGVFPKNLKFIWSSEMEVLGNFVKEKGYILYAIRIPENNEPYLSGKEIKHTTTGYDDNSGRITIDIEMTYRGRDKWAEMTTMNISRMIALTLDGKVIFAPIVTNSISTGRAQISGNLTVDYANSLVERINAFSELNQKR